jgi:mono/diheme cytochrome c family protein
VGAISLIFCQLTAVAEPTSSTGTAPARGTKVQLQRRLQEQRNMGKALFRANGCFDCHSINGSGCTEGVSLSSVGLRRNQEFMLEQLRDPDTHVERNKKAFNSEPNLMTNPNLNAKEVALIVTYLQSLRKPTPKKGECSKDYNSL